MSKKEMVLLLKNPGITLVATYVVLLIVNIGVIYAANGFFPNQVVLGTFSMNTFWAALHSMAALSLVATFAIPFFHELEKRRGHMLTPKEWMIYYFLLNAVAVWLITRASDQFGLGVSSWFVVVSLAVVFDLVQGAAMMQLEKFRTAK